MPATDSGGFGLPLMPNTLSDNQILNNSEVLMDDIQEADLLLDGLQR